MTRVLAALAIGTLALGGACAHASAVPASRTFSDITYEFREKPPGSDQTIEGSVRVLGDTAVVDAQPGPCRYLPGRGLGYISYQCDDVLLSVDLTSTPVRVSYSASKTVTEYKTTCIRYEVTPSGQRVCAQKQTDRVERKVPVSGFLHLIAADGTK